MPDPKATEADATAAGLATPQDTDLIAGGDDAIRRNARFVVDAMNTAEVARRDAAAAAVSGLQTTDTGPAYSVIDRDGRRTWIEVDTDGGPTDHSAALFGADPAVIASLGPSLGLGQTDTTQTDSAFVLVDQDGRLLELEFDRTGRVAPWVLAAWSSRMGGSSSTTVPAYPSADWIHWGDSLTESTQGGGWVAMLAAKTGRNHVNRGVGGQRTDEIAARQGGVPALLTVAGGTIPESGSVTVTASANLAARTTVPGTLAGVSGSVKNITNADSTTTIIFERTAPGTAVPVPARTPFYPDDGVAYAGRTVTLWAHVNSVAAGHSVPFIVTRYRAMVDYLTPRTKRVMVLEGIPGTGGTTGSAERARLDGVNNALAAAFPGYYLPVIAYLQSAAAFTAAGITRTADDDADIAAGIIPRSFRSDFLHLNAAGNTALAAHIHTTAQERGWL